MKKIVLFVILLLSTVSAGEKYFQNHILFCLKKDIEAFDIEYQNKEILTGNPGITRLLNKHGVVKLKKWLPGAGERDVVGEVKLANIYIAEFVTDKTFPELENILKDFRFIDDIHSAHLESINRIKTVTPPYVPSDIYYSRQWYIEKTMTDYAWGLWGDETPGDSTILVGVVDTGVDYLHPDLQDAMYVNLGEDANGDGIITEEDENNLDDDGNGYIDDFMGWDFAGASGGSEDNDIRPPEAGPYQELSHGTHVAGIMAATADNDLGIAGISFRSKIVATKHAADNDLTDPGIIYGYSGVLYCAQMGAKIINCSWGGDYDFYGKIVINDVTKNYNAIVVCAAGNDGTDNNVSPHYPSDFDNTIAVAATNKNDKKAYYSNFGEGVIDISAPGGEGSGYISAIYSTIHDSSYTAWQGTSMASPVAAGAFALLKAWFPDSSREWLIDNILFNTDYIDDINPSYAGKLGSGRVNIYNAIAHNLYPSLSIYQYSYEIINDNGDGYLNPGEGGNLKLTIENAANWFDANNVSVTLSSNSPYINFPDSVAEFGNIANGDTVSNLSGELIFQIHEDAPYEPVTVSVSIKSNQNPDYPYQNEENIELKLSLNQIGFPVLDLAVSSPVAVADLTGDNNKEIIVVDNDINCLMFKADGSLAQGFPVDIGFNTMAPIIADMNNDGEKEIVIVNNSGQVKVIKKNGFLLTGVNVAENVYGDAAVANMDAHPDLEIVFGTMQGNIHVVKIDSTELDGFPLKVPSPINQGIALADLTGDSIPEIIYGTFDSYLNILTAQGDTLEPFPVNLGFRINSTPVITRIEGEYHIIVSTVNNILKQINLNGVIEAEYAMTDALISAPSFCDVNKNDSVDVVFGTKDGKLHVVDLNGKALENFPIQLEGELKTSPVFADFNNDGDVEIVISSESGKLYIITRDGSLYPGFPAVLEGSLNGSASIADIDNDCDLEVIVGGSNGLNVLDVSDEKGQYNIWQTYLGNNRRTGYYQDAIPTSISAKKKIQPDNFELYQNFPNPFNPVTKITFNVPAYAAAKNVRLDVYNILGQKVVTLFNGKVKVGENTLTWNGRNSNGKLVTSGIYIYRLHSADITLTRRMLLIK